MSKDGNDARRHHCSRVWPSFSSDDFQRVVIILSSWDVGELVQIRSADLTIIEVHYLLFTIR